MRYTHYQQSNNRVSSVKLKSFFCLSQDDRDNTFVDKAHLFKYKWKMKHLSLLFSMSAVPHCVRKKSTSSVACMLLFEDSDDSVRDPDYVYDTNTVCSSDGVSVLFSVR